MEDIHETNSLEETNQLFPVFLRLDRLELLIVGGGEVGWEKLGIMFRHLDNARVTVVAPAIKEEIKDLAAQYPDNIRLIKRKFRRKDLKDKDLVIAATTFEKLNRKVWKRAKRRGLLINVADTPSLCDFYLASVVKKGDLKVAISSNGKSPTLTKRFRELLEDVLPEKVGDILDNLEEIRDQLQGDFEYKVNKLDEITSVMKNNKDQ